VVTGEHLSRQDIESAPCLQAEEPFRLVNFSGNGAFVPVPGWQALLKAKDPVGFFLKSDRLPKVLSSNVEEVLVIIDRANQIWDANSYFLVEVGNNLELKWFDSAPNLPIMGQLILIMRPKKILDENNITEPWQMDD
jgi:hypothetical protein